MFGKFIKSHKFQTIVDIIHIGICIAIVLLAVFIFLEPLAHDYCYPFVFLLAAILNFVNALARYSGDYARRGKIFPMFFQIFLGIILMIITFVSAASIWRV